MLVPRSNSNHFHSANNGRSYNSPVIAGQRPALPRVTRRTFRAGPSSSYQNRPQGRFLNSLSRSDAVIRAVRG